VNVWVFFLGGGVGRERGHYRRSLDPRLFGTLNLLFVWWDKWSHWPPFRERVGFSTPGPNGLEFKESLTLILLLSCNVRPCSPLFTCNNISTPPSPSWSNLYTTELVVMGVYERWKCVHPTFQRKRSHAKSSLTKQNVTKKNQRGNKFGKVEDYKCKRYAWRMKLGGMKLRWRHGMDYRTK
jgi:hypothetical protein